MAFLKRVSLGQYICLAMIAILFILDANHIFTGVLNHVLSFVLICYITFSKPKC